MVYMNKRKAYEDRGREMNENLKENDTLLWKEVNECRRELYVKSESVLDKCGRTKVTKDEVCKSWRKCFRELIGNDGEPDVLIEWKSW